MNLDILYRILSADVTEDIIADWSLRFPFYNSKLLPVPSKDNLNVDEIVSM